MRLVRSRITLKIGLFIIISVLSFSSFAQQKKELEYSGFFDSYYYRGPLTFLGGAGLAFYSGDICDKIGCNNITPSFMVGVGYKIWPRVLLGADINIIRLSVNDVFESRGLSYTGNNFELLVHGRFYLIDDVIRRQTDMNKKKKVWRPYIGLGIGSAYYSSKSTILISSSDSTSSTASTNGNGIVPFVTAFRLGSEFRLSSQFSLSLEGSYRLVFSDTFDGYEAGSNNDTYASIFLKLQYSPFAKRKKSRKKIKKSDLEQYQRMVNEANGVGTGDSTNTNELQETPASSEPVDDLPENDNPYYEDESESEEDLLPDDNGNEDNSEGYEEEDGYLPADDTDEPIENDGDEHLNDLLNSGDSDDEDDSYDSSDDGW